MMILYDVKKNHPVVFIDKFEITSNAINGEGSSTTSGENDSYPAYSFSTSVALKSASCGLGQTAKDKSELHHCWKSHH